MTYFHSFSKAEPILLIIFCNLSGEVNRKELPLMDKEYQLSDLFNLEEYQKFQDNIATALELGFITVDYLGRPAFKYSGFTEFCNRLRKRKECHALCQQCDAHGGIQATITGEPYIYTCHAGLVDFAVPLILEGKYMGSLMGGQVQIEGPAPDLAPIIPQKVDWQDDPELVDAFTRVHKLSYEKLVARVYLLRDVIQNKMKEKYREILQTELEKKENELREEKALRINLEKALDESASNVMDHYSSEFLFYVMNIVTRLAYQENAETTERAAYDAAYIIRYASENNRNEYVMLGEEITCVERYLNMQTLRLGKRLMYDIRVPEKYYGAMCPFMLLMNFATNAIEHGIDESSEQGKIEIEAKVNDEILILSVSDSGKGMTRRTIQSLLSKKRKKQKQGNITNINYQIKDLFGEFFGISILSREDDFPGTQIQIRLPYNYGNIESVN